MAEHDVPKSDGPQWGQENLKPIALALAAGIFICAVPAAYRISKCEDFSAGFSLQQLFSFKCEGSKPKEQQPKAPQSATAEEDSYSGVSARAMLAPTLALPTGYVSYRVFSSGLPRKSGRLTPADDNDAPAFSEVQTGLVLRATADKEIHTRPFEDADRTTESRGQCFTVIEGTRITDEPATSTRSGGWLPVELSPCEPGASAGGRQPPAQPKPQPTPTVSAASRGRQPSPPTVTASPGTPSAGSLISKNRRRAAGQGSEEAGPGPVSDADAGKSNATRTGSTAVAFEGLGRDQFRAKYSHDFAPYTWHVIVKSVFSQNAADQSVQSLNARYPNIWFQETQMNDTIWGVTLGAGIGGASAMKLQSFAHTLPGFRDAYAYCWSVGRSDPDGKCAQ